MLLCGCVTPSVPIPPPSPDQMVFEIDVDAGSASFEFDPERSYANAIVYVFNRSLGEGIITTADPNGRVPPTEPFPAAAGDEVVITFEVATQLPSTCVILRQGRSDAGQRCDL